MILVRQRRQVDLVERWTPNHLMAGSHVLCRPPCLEENKVAKAKRPARKPYTSADVKLLKHSKARTPVSKISKQMKRTVGSLRQKAQKLGIGLGHQR
jgi:hypothetical protein